MAGYHNYSMSNNAVSAYESGEKPLSKWTKAEMVKQAIPYLTCDVSLFKRLTVKEMRRVALCESSWHHTSSWYNKTSFYSIDDDYLSIITDEEIRRIIERRIPKEETYEQKCICEFLEWSGTRKHPKATVVTEEGVIKGNWFYRNDGTKKSINANGFKIITKGAKK